MEITPHPCTFISREITDAVSAYAADAEQLGELHPMQLEQIYKHHFFNLFVPKNRGGLELNLPEALRTEESLAWADGSTGWTVTLCAGANWFIGFLQPEATNEIFKDPKSCLAGSGKVSGTARVVNDGYEINGKWKYATGAPHATIFTANCMIEDGGTQDRNGGTKVTSFWFKKKEVIIHRDWDAMGMISTASHSFEVKQLHVPKNRTFIIDGQHSYLNLPIYQYPFLQFAESTLAVNISGMAMRFLDLLEEKLRKGSLDEAGQPANLSLNKKLVVARSKLDDARTDYYVKVKESWQQLTSTGTIHSNLLQQVSGVSIGLASVAREIVDQLFPYSGMEGASNRSSLNRVWRNLHTASQHILLREMM